VRSNAFLASKTRQHVKDRNDSVTKIALQTQAESNGYVINIRSPRAYNLQRSQEMPAKRLLVGIIALLLL